ncbi:MAG: DUF72 domain-containing protein [Deltaproteobacteria bacterium]|nr:DUF72 domain-containing protein [Deltaproteobacteria bacterium]MCB9787898.1 DUF72 domain-containing protein [Deltaproteobacteria bacterium]
MAERGPIRIGVSGWRYAPWRGTFYPEGWKQARELEYASRQLGAIEINGTFYSLQSARSFRAWYDACPRGFRFAVKGSRYLTHMKRLKDFGGGLANFFAQGLLALEEKLGPILWQLPPNFRFDAERIARFLSALPRNTEDAAALAREHDPDKLAGESVLDTGARRSLGHALEVRHPSFACEELVALCREQRVALVVADSPEDWPYTEDVTASFVYLRLHGSADAPIYQGRYTDAALDGLAKKVDRWSRGGEPRDAARLHPERAPKLERREVFVFFDNTDKVQAPFDALALSERLGLDHPGEELPSPPGRPS